MIKTNLYILFILLFSIWSCSDKGDPISCNDDIDCLGECGGNAQIDECGICGGTGIPDDQCDCNGNILDECGICGGEGPGECGCESIPDGSCDCDGNILDECGVCGGTGIPDDQCDCNGNILDECGICGGGSSTCISFSNDIKPILNQYCTNCHGSSGNLSLESYNDMMSANSVVIPGNHTESSLWTEVNSGSMPKYSTKLDQELINKIANWINQGALDN